MATIKYQCSVCKRNVELLEKPSGLNVFSKCIITNGCKGKLNKLSRNPDSQREVFPPPDDGLQDFTQRKSFYKHTQDLQNTVWKVNHNLGVAPVVEVYVNNNGLLQPLNFDQYQIKIIDKNNLQVVLPTVQSGMAHCIARSTVQSFDYNSIIPEKMFQVTTGGLFAFAFPRYITHFTVNPPSPTPTLPVDTETPPRPIRIEVSLIQPNSEEVICTETIPNAINNETPWKGWNEILLRKRRNYDIKIKSIFDFKRTLQLDTITKGDIAEGTQIRFLRVDYGTGALQPIEQDNVLLLLSNPPFNSIDKITNQIIDTGYVLFSKNDYFTYSKGEVYTNINNVESIYPIIEKVN